MHSRFIFQESRFKGGGDMFAFPADFDPEDLYVVELVELEIGRRLYVRPADAPRSQWFRFETVPLSGKELLNWTQNPEVSERHSNCLTNGGSFVTVGGSWMTEQEWAELMRTSERVK